MNHAPGFLQLVEEVRPRVTEVTAAQVAERLSSLSASLSASSSASLSPSASPAPGGFRLIDVREDHEWEAGHIVGASHLGKGVIERDIEATVPGKDDEIILYCGGGFRSALAADALQRMGYRKVRSLAGGYRGWTEAGLPIAREAQGPATATATATPAEPRRTSMIPQTILVGTDLDDDSLPALRAAIDMARPLHARLIVVYVIEPTPAPPGLEAFALEGMPIDWEKRLDQGREVAVTERLRQLLAEHADPAVPMEGRVIFGMLPGALTQAAKDLSADLMVVGTHGRSGMAHLFLGSVAEKVVRTAPCPVLSVRPTPAQ